MASKCPPGVFCIENYTLLIVIIISILILLYLNNKFRTTNNDKSLNIDLVSNISSLMNNLKIPRNFITNNNNDVLLNPYEPPLRNNNIFINSGQSPPGIPINIPTQSVDSTYRQVGILTRTNGDETILPLMGKPLFTNRDKWNFYTMSDKNNSIKLPISYKKKSCTNEYGCDNLNNGDMVYVEGYNDAFKVTSYDNNTMRYIPYL
jgi:hypothetical protein|uniref:Uncharacterized protein n=1 Tax=Nucleocytoviricota sp. TaxID=2809609 RepID=A0A9E8G505_9VIRU|nr:hypothetical protein [Nucleocytoviricota sp.]UZT29201.1 hypothetical protein [Nucleocytoviricota sp.]